MTRIRTAAGNFAVNFAVGYLLGRRLGDRATGVRAGVALGALGAVAAWALSGGGDEPPDVDDGEPIEIEID